MQEYSLTQKLMGTVFTLGVVAVNETEANAFLEAGVAEIQRLEDLLSEFKPGSVTSKINTHAQEDWVRIDTESYGLIKRSLAISRLCKGDFDITVAPLKKLFRFKNTDFEMPGDDDIASALEKTGYDKLLLDDASQAVRFAVKGMKISFAAIGKGFAADMVISKWKYAGLRSGFVSASGDIRVLGVNSTGAPWKAGIANPDAIDKTLFQLSLQNNAIATSGNSQQYFVWNNRKWSHNINPHTGMPLQGIKSVTIVAPGAELSDALATAVYVKGVKKGLEFVNQLPQTHAVIIDERDKIHFSKNLAYETITADTVTSLLNQLRKSETI